MNTSNQRSRIFLAAPTADCEEEFCKAVIRSDKLHHPWILAPHTREQYFGYLERIKSGRTIPNLIRLTADNRLAGVINISEPVMGVFKSAYLGFYAFAGYERQGLMTEGLALVLDRAFNELDFHRLEANIQPPTPPRRRLFNASVFARKASLQNTCSSMMRGAIMTAGRS